MFVSRAFLFGLFLSVFIFTSLELMFGVQLQCMMGALDMMGCQIAKNFHFIFEFLCILF